MTNEQNKRNGKESLTVLSLATLALLALTVIILAAFVYVNWGWWSPGQSHRARALADMKALDIVLETYHADNGAYPTTQQGLWALIAKTAIPPLPKNWQGPYIRVNHVPNDPWGNPYIYICPGKRHPNSFDLYSYGADGLKGGKGDGVDIDSTE